MNEKNLELAKMGEFIDFLPFSMKDIVTLIRSPPN